MVVIGKEVLIVVIISKAAVVSYDSDNSYGDDNNINTNNNNQRGVLPRTATPHFITPASPATLPVKDFPHPTHWHSRRGWALTRRQIKSCVGHSTLCYTLWGQATRGTSPTLRLSTSIHDSLALHTLTSNPVFFMSVWTLNPYCGRLLSCILSPVASDHSLCFIQITDPTALCRSPKYVFHSPSFPFTWLIHSCQFLGLLLFFKHGRTTSAVPLLSYPLLALVICQLLTYQLVVY